MEQSRTFLIDANMFIDIFAGNPIHGGWSLETFVRCAAVGEVAINQIVYAELSAGYESLEQLEGDLSDAALLRLNLPWEAAFAAGRAYRQYRERGGERRSPLPDFYIGAHAAIAGLTLVTRDATRYRTYFPALNIVAP